MEALKALLYRYFGPDAAAYLTSLQELSMLPASYNSINFHLLLHSNVPWTEEEVQLVGQLVTSPFLMNESTWRAPSLPSSRSMSSPHHVTPSAAPPRAYPAPTTTSSYLYEVLQGVSSGYDLFRWLLLLETDDASRNSITISTAMNTILPLLPTSSNSTNNWATLSPQQRDGILTAISSTATATTGAAPPLLYILKSHLSTLFAPSYTYFPPSQDPYYYSYPPNAMTAALPSSSSTGNIGTTTGKGASRLKYSPEMKLTATAHYYRANGDLSEAIASLHTNPAYRRVTKTMLSRWVKSDPLEEKPKGGRPYSLEFEQAVMEELFSSDSNPVITYEGVRTAGIRVRERFQEYQTHPLTKDLKFSDKWVRGFLRRNNLATTTTTTVHHDSESDGDA